MRVQVRWHSNFLSPNAFQNVTVVSRDTKSAQLANAWPTTLPPAGVRTRGHSHFKSFRVLLFALCSFLLSLCAFSSPPNIYLLFMPLVWRSCRYVTTQIEIIIRPRTRKTKGKRKKGAFFLSFFRFRVRAKSRRSSNAVQRQLKKKRNGKCQRGKPKKKQFAKWNTALCVSVGARANIKDGHFQIHDDTGNNKNEKQ